MKKFLSLALCACAGLGALQAQDAKSLFEQAKKLDDAFNKSKPTQLAPNAQVTPESAKGLIDAYDLFQQVLVLDQQPNEKGQVKPKYTKKVEEAIKKHTDASDFVIAGGVLFNAGQRYPEAYKAFMLSGDLGAKSGTVPDSIYSVDYFNAGNSAYGTDFKAAALAYTKAREAGSQEYNAYMYNIGALQNLANQDTAFAKEASEQIHEIAKQGVELFGADKDFMLNNYLQYFFENQDYDAALAALAEVEKANPDVANVYRLRGIINNARHQYAEAIPAFEKMAQLTDNFDYLYKAASDLNAIGKLMMGNLGTKVTPEQKTEVLAIFNNAKAIADKAGKVQDTDEEAVKNIVEDINYSLENANKL